MIASAHVAAGVVIGVIAARLMRWPAGRIAAAFAASVLVHLEMDAIPHSDYHTLSWTGMLVVVALELNLVGIVAYHLLRHRLPPQGLWSVAAGVFGSALPDAKFMAPLLPSELARLVQSSGDRLHHAIHAAPTSLAYGMMTQVSCAVLLIAALLLFPRLPASTR
jgi:hypothetical protein